MIKLYRENMYKASHVSNRDYTYIEVFIYIDMLLIMYLFKSSPTLSLAKVKL